MYYLPNLRSHHSKLDLKDHNYFQLQQQTPSFKKQENKNKKAYDLAFSRPAGVRTYVNNHLDNY